MNDFFKGTINRWHFYTFYEMYVLLTKLSVVGFSSHSRIFQSHGDSTIAGERLQILIYARHS